MNPKQGARSVKWNKYGALRESMKNDVRGRLQKKKIADNKKGTEVTKDNMERDVEKDPINSEGSSSKSKKNKSQGSTMKSLFTKMR